MPPLMGFVSRGASVAFDCPSGYHPHRDWLVSEETADPPGLYRLMTITNVRAKRGPGVASSGSGVRRRPLSNRL
jgi:hypothetical protein